jgi:hypothetical protein
MSETPDPLAALLELTEATIAALEATRLAQGSDPSPPFVPFQRWKDLDTDYRMVVRPHVLLPLLRELQERRKDSAMLNALEAHGELNGKWVDYECVHSFRWLTSDGPLREWLAANPPAASRPTPTEPPAVPQPLESSK